MHPDLSFLIFAIPRQPLITLSMTKGERLATGVLSSLEVMIQKRGQLVDVRVFVAEVGLVSVSSSDTNGDPSFFLLILLCRFPDGKEPGAAAGEEEFEVAMVMFKFFTTQGPHPPRSPTRGHSTWGRAQHARVPGLPEWYNYAQCFLTSAMLARLYTKLALATCPLKGWTSHDQPIDQIGPDLTTRLSELRAKVMCCRGKHSPLNHQDPVIRFTGRNPRQTGCLIWSPCTTCQRGQPTYSNPGRLG